MQHLQLQRRFVIFPLLKHICTSNFDLLPFSFFRMRNISAISEPLRGNKILVLFDVQLTFDFRMSPQYLCLLILVKITLHRCCRHQQPSFRIISVFFKFSNHHNSMDLLALGQFFHKKMGYFRCVVVPWGKYLCGQVYFRLNCSYPKMQMNVIGFQLILVSFLILFFL